jgi:hypothetical protein
MKSFRCIMILIIGLVVLKANAQVEKESFAVIELFTSEGCSSCPPADNLLVQLKEHQSLNSYNTLVIARHVTYWDYLGWTDPYGIKRNDDDQRAYCTKIGSQVYTPQFVVNGQYISLNGNNILSYASNAVSQTPETGIKLSLLNDANAKNIEVKYELNNLENGKKIRVFLLESNLSQNVTSGENHGKTLNHDYVCRYVVDRIIDNDGKVIIPVPDDVIRGNSIIAAYAFDPSSLEIIAATKGFNLVTSSIQETTNNSEIKIFPNPGSGIFHIHELRKDAANYQVINMFGQVIKQSNITTNQIDLSDLENGNYLIMIFDTNGIFQSKSIISKIN